MWGNSEKKKGREGEENRPLPAGMFFPPPPRQHVPSDSYVPARKLSRGYRALFLGGKTATLANWTYIQGRN